MRYICITHIDKATGILCTDAPMTTGPAFPNISGFVYKWSNESEYPITCNSDGSYMDAPKFYGVCDDDADLTVVGVIAVLTEDDWDAAEQAEILARKPEAYPSFVWSADIYEWIPPLDRPADAVINGGDTRYYWDEDIVNWVKVT